MKLDGKVAIITGAGAGIGEATAILFAKEGAKICCNSKSDSALKVVEKIEHSGGVAFFSKGDVSVVEDAKKSPLKRWKDTENWIFFLIMPELLYLEESTPRPRKSGIKQWL